MTLSTNDTLVPQAPADASPSSPRRLFLGSANAVPGTDVVRSPFVAVQLAADEADRRELVLIVSVADLDERHVSVVRSVKRVRPDASILLSHYEGRANLLAELVLQGADGTIDMSGTVRYFGQSNDRVVNSHVAETTEAGSILSPEELAALLDNDF
jgi:hypothetical protein